MGDNYIRVAPFSSLCKPQWATMLESFKYSNNCVAKNTVKLPVYKVPEPANPVINQLNKYAYSAPLIKFSSLFTVQQPTIEVSSDSKPPVNPSDYFESLDSLPTRAKNDFTFPNVPVPVAQDSSNSLIIMN